MKNPYIPVHALGNSKYPKFSLDKQKKKKKGLNYLQSNFCGWRRKHILHNLIWFFVVLFFEKNAKMVLLLTNEFQISCRMLEFPIHNRKMQKICFYSYKNTTNPYKSVHWRKSLQFFSEMSNVCACTDKSVHLATLVQQNKLCFNQSKMWIPIQKVTARSTLFTFKCELVKLFNGIAFLSSTQSDHKAD